MKAIVILGLILLALPAARAADDPLAVARELYASASYEEALTALDGIKPSTEEVTRQVGMYRVFCLYALGRMTEAEKVAESLIRREPLMELDEAAPRIEAMFQSVRKRLLPSLIRTEYRTAKMDLDEKKPQSATAHLIDARQMLARAQKIGAWDEGLADLQVLVDGFLELTRATVDKPPPAEPDTPAKATAVEIARRADASPMPMQSGAPVPSSYGPEDEGVTPPSAMEQRVPRLPEQLRRLLRGTSGAGVIDLVIDETGAVQQSSVRTSIHPAYDALILAESRGWRYVPATRNGVPVRYRKSIQITVN